MHELINPRTSWSDVVQRLGQQTQAMLVRVGTRLAHPLAISARPAPIHGNKA